jgi:hypothetical protein
MQADAALRKAAASIPSLLQMSPMAASITDSAQLIMSRLFISQMIYKWKILLHRRYLQVKSASEDKGDYSYSRKTCLDASLSTLQIQHILDEETCPGGQLYPMAWRITPLVQYQFLTATMILCSLLYTRHTDQREGGIRTALRKTREIRLRNSSLSREAKRGADMMNIVLAKADDGNVHDLDLSGNIPDGLANCQTLVASGGKSNMRVNFDGDTTFQQTLDNYDCKYHHRSAHLHYS